MVERGDATPQDVDVLIKSWKGHPMGPLNCLTIGHDTMDLIMQGGERRYRRRLSLEGVRLSRSW